MADELPGLQVAITGDPSGALKALDITRKAVASTADVTRRAFGSGNALSGLTAGIQSVGRAMASLPSRMAGGLQALTAVPATAQRALGAVSGLAGKLAGVGAVAGAALGGALAMAAQQDGGVAVAMASLQATTGALAVEVARAVLPAVRALTQGIADLTAGFRGLDPEVKASIGSWSVFGVKALAVVGVVGKLAGLGASVAGLAAAALPLVVALAAAALGAGALYKALKDATGVDVSTIKNAWLDFAGTMLGFYGKLAAGWLSMVNTMRTTLRTLKEEVKDVFRPDINYADLMSPDAAVRTQTQAALDAKVSARQLPTDDFLVKLQKKLEEGLTGEDLKKTLKTGADGVGDALKYSFDGLKNLAKDLGAQFGLDKLLKGGLPGAGKGQVIGPQITPIGASLPTINALAPPNTFNVGDAAVLDAQRRDAEAYADAYFSYSVDLDQAKMAYYAAEKAKLPSLLQAFDVFAEGWHESFMKLDAQARGIIGTAVGHLQGMLGKAGGVFDAVTQGMAAGGPMGALVGGIGALLAGSQQAEGLKNVMDSIMQQLSDSIGVVLEPIITIFGGVAAMLAPLFQMVADVLSALFTPLQGLSAAFVALGAIFGAFGAVVGAFAELLGGLVGGVLDMAFRALFEVLKFVGQVILGVAAAIESAWNEIAKAVLDFFDFVRQVFPVDKVAGLDAIMASFEAMLQPSTQFGDALTELNKLTYESATAKAKETAASMKLKDAMRETAAELLNVPDVLKVTLRRFQASQEEGLPGEAPGGPGGTGGASGGSRPPPGVGPGGAGPGGLPPPPPPPPPTVNVYLGGQKLRTQVNVDMRKNRTLRSDAEVEAAFQGGA